MSHDDILAEAAEHHGIPDKLPILKKMLMAESGGKVDAVSPKGAGGLMQLMPGTAEALGVKDRFDPRENIFGGVKYYKEQLDAFGGDDALALAAYNAGPGNVNKYGGIPPFKETQNYVAKILQAGRKVAGHTWSLVAPKEAITADNDENIDAAYLLSREEADDQEFREWLNRYSPPAQDGGKKPNVVQQAIPKWAGGSLMDMVNKVFPMNKTTGPKPDRLTPATGGGPEPADIGQWRDTTTDEWRQMDEEGYKKYQMNLSAMGIPSEAQESLTDPWIDPVNVIAGFGGGLAVGGVKAALGSLLGNVVGEVTGGLAGEYLTEQQKPQWAWVAALAVDVATGMTIDKAMGKAITRLKKVRPNLNDEQALNVVKSAAGHSEVKEVAEALQDAAQIEKALQNGQPVSGNILKNYPTLSRKYNQSAEFLKTPDGTDSFGVLEDAYPVRLQVGDHDQNTKKGFGAIHIEANHGNQIRQNGYDTIEDFVYDVVQNHKKIWQKGDTLLLAKTNGKDKLAFLELKADRNGFFTVKTAFVSRQGYIQESKGWKLLWEQSAPDSTSSGEKSPFARSPEKSAGQGAPDAEGQSNLFKENIPTPGDKVNPDDDITMEAGFGLGQFFKKFFKEEGGGSGVKAGEPGAPHRTGPDRRTLPEGGVVVLKKKPADLEADPDWVAAKNQNDLAAARRFADKTWNKSAAAQLEQALGAEDVVFISAPSTSRQNVIPLGLAQKLAAERDGTAIRGDDYFNPVHAQQAKNIPRQERLFAPRKFVSGNPDELAALTEGKKVVVVDDIYTSGGTTKAFVFALQDMGLDVHPKVVGLYGETRFISKPKDVERLGTALQGAFGDIFKPEEVQYIANRLTRQEIGDNLLPLLYKAKGDANVRDKVSRHLQGLLGERAPGNVGADQKPGGHSGGNPRGSNPGDERLPPGSQAGGAQASSSVQGQAGLETIADTYRQAGIEVILPKPGQPLYPPDKTDRFLAEPFLTDLKDGKYAVNINLQRIESPEEITDAIRKMAELEGVEMDTARRGVMSFEDTERLADMVGLTPEKLLARRQGEAFNAETALAARRLLVSAGVQVRELAAKVASPQGSEADMIEFRRSMSVMAAIQQQVAGMTAEAGRSLAAFRIMATETAMANKMIKDWMEAGGGPDMAKKMAEAISALDTPEQVAKVVSKAYKATAWDVFLEIWINNLLSGPATHMRNVLGNSAAMLMQVPERYVAGKIAKLTGGEVASGEASAMMWGLANGWTDAFRLAAKALKTGESSDLLGKIELPRKAISAQALDLSGVPGRAVDMLGEIIRLPGRGLLAADEFFKAVGYRMELHAQAYRTAAAEGLQGQALGARVADILADPPANIKIAGIDAARYQTFTQPAGPIASGFAGIAQKVPMFKLLAPFIRTPSNIFRFTMERTPLAPLMASFRNDILAGGARRDLALSRMALGSMVMGVGTVMAQMGYITGGGPNKKEFRDNMYRYGWQPYSIKIGDTYYAYGGLEPHGTMIGMAADFQEMAGQLPDEQASEIACMLAAAAGKVFVNKLYLKGLGDALNAMINPAAYGQKFVSLFAGSLIPFSALVATGEREIDATKRDIRAGRESWFPGLQTAINAAKGRIPGYSDDLPPQRNLWGEEIFLQGALGPDWISPIYTSKDNKSPIDKEMVKHDVAIDLPRRVIHNVPLTAMEYDRFVMLAGNELKDPDTGLGCKDALADMIKSEEYNQATNGEGGDKAYMIKNIILAYRKAAARQMLEEFPELRDLAEKKQVDRRNKLIPEE